MLLIFMMLNCDVYPTLGALVSHGGQNNLNLPCKLEIDADTVIVLKDSLPDKFEF